MTEDELDKQCTMSTLSLISACRQSYKILEDLITIKGALCYSPYHLNKADLQLLFKRIDDAEELISRTKGNKDE